MKVKINKLQKQLPLLSWSQLKDKPNGFYYSNNKYINHALKINDRIIEISNSTNTIDNIYDIRHINNLDFTECLCYKPNAVLEISNLD